MKRRTRIVEPNTINIVLGFTILVILYALLVLEIMHRTAAALLAVSIVLILDTFLRFSDFNELVEGIDMNTILLLMSMMMFVGILSRTGAFSYLASMILIKFHNKPFLLITILSSITALVSAFIDNVTTVLLMTPIVLEIMEKLKVDPRPILLSIVFASNIGGTATLIGDPPNIIIGTRAGLGFMDFIRNLAPIVVIDFFAFLILIKVMFSKWINLYESRVRVIRNLQPSNRVDKYLLHRTLIILSVVIVLFLLEDFLEYPPAIPPLIGIGVLLLLLRNRIRIESLLEDVDWSTLVFFIAMFIVIKGVEDLGVMEFIAREIYSFSTDYMVLILLILWVSAIVSAFVDNIPFVMAMVPVIAAIARAATLNPIPLYWALSLGGCLGGNGTLVGASANVVVAGIAERHGYTISFRSFIRYGMPVLMLTVGLASIYLVLRYVILG